MAEAGHDFITPDFLREAAAALEELGFVADDHAFAPFREAITANVGRVREALRLDGHPYDLAPGFLKGHPQAGYAYFVYDAARFRDQGAAVAAVGDWLDRRLGTEGEDG